MMTEPSVNKTLPQGFIDFCRANESLSGLPEVLIATASSNSVRVNRRKGISAPMAAERVPWNVNGFYLDERPKYTFDPALHQGLYYVQDASSMALGRIVGQLVEKLKAERSENNCSPLCYLDACAAPGGKTTAAIDALPDDFLIVANEYDPRRATALAENIERWGYPNIMVRRGDTKAFAALAPCFDIIAADVPCSGEGMMRKEPEAVAQWSPALINDCAHLQREILTNLWPALRPGGYLIYSTCTFNRAENEDNVRWMIDELGANAISTDLCTMPGVVPALDDDIFAARFIPGKVRGEGLFLAVVQKPIDENNSLSQRPAKKHKNTTTKVVDKKMLTTAASWLKGDFIVEAFGDDRLRALPSIWAEQIHRFTETLGGIILAGVEVATINGRDLIPAHTLALSTALRRDAFAIAELDWHQAITFLRREPLALPDAPRGIILLSYRQHPIGFVKNLGNRANNLLPASRRILSSSLPDNSVNIL